MKRLLWGVAGWLLAGAALAGGPRAVRERAESSMVVTGTIGVTTQGTVLAYTLDQPDKLPAPVVELLGKNIPHWTFQPVLRDGKPVVAKSSMSLRVVAQPAGNGGFRLSVRSAYFGDPAHGIRKDRNTPPRYPREAIRQRLGGTVYLALQIDRAGTVVDAVAQQVNLLAVADDRTMERWRKLFAAASVNAAREWGFTPAEPSDHELYRVIRVPVAYRINEGPSRPSKPAYGTWESYVPGPLEPVPWPDTDRLLSGDTDALPDDGVFGRSSLSLLTPLDPG